MGSFHDQLIEARRAQPVEPEPTEIPDHAGYPFPCTTCGALILPETWAIHADWHKTEG